MSQHALATVKANHILGFAAWEVTVPLGLVLLKLHLKYCLLEISSTGVPNIRESPTEGHQDGHVARAHDERLQEMGLLSLEKRSLWGSSLVPASTYRAENTRLLQVHSEATGTSGSKENSS